MHVCMNDVELFLAPVVCVVSTHVGSKLCLKLLKGWRGGALYN